MGVLVMIFVRAIQIFCLIESILSQSFLYDNKTTNTNKKKAGDYTINGPANVVNKSGKEVLAEAGVPEDVAETWIEALTAYKQYNERKLFFTKHPDKAKGEKIIKKMMKNIPEKCNKENICLKSPDCIECAKHWKIKLKNKKKKKRKGAQIPKKKKKKKKK